MSHTTSEVRRTPSRTASDLTHVARCCVCRGAELRKTLEKFHIALNSHDLVVLMNLFPSAKSVNASGLAAFDFRAFANALYPPES